MLPGWVCPAGFPGSMVRMGATRVFPIRRAMDSPMTFRTWLCFPVVR
jgi:hypothetical protein